MAEPEEKSTIHLSQPNADSNRLLEASSNPSNLPGDRFREWFPHLKVGQKIGWGYAIALGLAVAGATAGSILGYSYQQKARQLLEDALEETVLIERLQLNLAQGQIHQQKLAALLEQPEQFQEEYTHFRQHIAGFQQAWFDFKASYKTLEIEESAEEVKAHDKLVGKYEGLIEVYLQQTEAIVQQITLLNLKPEEIEAAQKLLLNFNLSPLVLQLGSFSEDLEEINEILAEEEAEAAAELKATERLWVQIIAVSMILSIVIAIIFAIQTSRAIARPIQQVTEVAKKVTQESNFRYKPR